MPSKIDIVTRNRTVYAGASPPTVDVGFFTVAIAGVDLKTAGTTTIFTVPTGRTFFCTNSYAIVTAVNTGGSGTEQYSIKESSSSRVMSSSGGASAAHTPVAGQTTYVQANVSGQSPYSSCTAGNIVQVVVVTSHAGSTGVTGTVYVTGFYTQ